MRLNFSLLWITMKGERKNSTTTVTGKESIDEGYPRLFVEKGEVYFRDKNTGEMKKMKGYIIGRNCDIENPITIGREHPETIGKKDIILPAKYYLASREHCEIFFDRNENAYFLVDCSLNGTFVNGNRVGGNRVRKVRRLEHDDLIEILTSEEEKKEKVQLRFLMHKRPGLIDWGKGELAEKSPVLTPQPPPTPPSEEKKFCMFCGAEMVKEALYCPRCGRKQ